MQDELKKIGLSENEAKVYLALLEMGSATADEVAKKAGVKRPTTYVQLEALRKQGLVSSFEKQVKKGGAEKTFFRAEDPEYLKKIADREKKKADERENILREALPELQKLFSFSGERPKVRFFEGVEGLKTAQEEFLKSGAREVLSIVSIDDVIKFFPSHTEEYSSKRSQKKISAKLIYTSSRGHFLKKSDNDANRESRFIPKEKLSLSCDISVYENTVAIFALREKPIGVMVEDKDIANSIRAVFYLIWDYANQFNA